VRVSGEVDADPVAQHRAPALDVVLTRRSALSLREPGPDDATLRAMLAAAMCGPDHGRLAPWHFIVIEGGGRHAFGRVLRESLRRRLPQADEAMLAREEAKALRVPTIVVVAAHIRDDVAIPAVEQQIAAGIAAYNILLAAHAFGLAGMWRTGVNAYDAGVRHALGLAENMAIVAFLYVGTPGAVPKPRAPYDMQHHISRWPPPGAG
jgi:nitroreductase